MKKLLLSVAALAAVMGTGAQTAAAQENSNQTSIRVAGWEVLLDGRVSTPHVPEYKTSRYYGGRIGTFEIGFNGLREPSGAYALYPADESGFMDPRVGKSIHLTFNVFTFSASLARNNVVGITAGMGFTINNYAMSTPNTYVKDGRLLRPVDPGHYLKKSKLNTFAIHFPVALEFNPSRRFFFSVGGYVDLVTGAHMKWKSPKEKLRGLGSNFLQAGATFRIGFRHAYLFTSYDFVELFRGGHGPVLNPYTVGVGFGF